VNPIASELFGLIVNEPSQYPEKSKGLSTSTGAGVLACSTVLVAQPGINAINMPSNMII
jgi:hypothetical protein